MKWTGRGSGMGQIIEFPDDKKARERLEALKQTLEELIFEKNHLQYITCENIQMEYMLIFGSLEYELYQSYCKYLRLRRKRELIQAKINRQEKINMKIIELQLDEEFEAYQQQLNEKIEEINQALARSKADKLPADKAAQLKKCYRSIVKKLHPDLNPNITEAEIEMFYHATDAYKDGDLQAIQLIFEIVCSDGMESEATLKGKSLHEEVERLEGLVSQIQNEIEQIQTTPPYIWSIYLTDETKKSEKLDELKQDIEEFKQAIRIQEEYIEQLMRDAT